MDARIKTLTYTDNWTTESNKVYSYTIADGVKATAWKGTNAYKEKGTSMTPVSGTVYYLKEVPNSYLRPYIHVVYDIVDNNTIKQLYTITAVDDANYKEAGFYDGSKDSSSTNLSATIKITQKGSTKVTTLTAKGIFNDKEYPDNAAIKLPRGYLTSIATEFSADFDMQPYFKTLDGVKVYGVTNRTVLPGDGTFVDDGNGVGKLPGITTTDVTNKLDVE